MPRDDDAPEPGWRERWLIVQAAKHRRDRRGLPPYLTNRELDRLGLPSMERWRGVLSPAPTAATPAGPDT